MARDRDLSGDISDLVKNGKAGMASAVAKWLVNQGFGNILLLIIVYGAYKTAPYAIDVAIPAHLASIKQGYKEIQDQQSQNVKGLIEAQERSTDKICATFERERDKQDKQIERLMTVLEDRKEKAVAPAKGQP